MRALRRLRRDARGLSAVEFGLIAPVLCLFLVGAFDLLHRSYEQHILEGEIQKVARDSTLEGAPLKLAEIDERMRKAVKIVAPDAEVKVTRDTYPTFLAIKPERFDDTNGNGRRDAGECFDDLNGNRNWDVSPSRKGQGGANDVTVLRTVVKFPRMLPMAAALKWEPKQVIVSETILKNQPFAAQAASVTEPVCN